MATRRSSFQWGGSGALLRASTDPGGLDLPEDLDLFAADASARGLAWLAQVVGHAEVRAALALASPALIAAIDALLACEEPDVRQVRRAVVAMASYLLRWQCRATPFGLFAGVCLARIGARTQVRWGKTHRTVVRPDAAWLGDVLARLQQCPELLERLTVVANNTGGVRGDRFVVPGPAPDQDPHALAPIEVSVRYSSPVNAAVDAAREPVAFGELATLLAGIFPHATMQQIRRMLTELVSQNILISSLWAPMTCPDPLDYVCTTLQTARAEDLRDVGNLVRALYAVHKDLSTAAAELPGPDVAARLSTLIQAPTDSVHVLWAVDTIVDGDIQIPEHVAREAGDAAAALCRLSPYPFGSAPWRDYHARFRARYGTGTLVPVLELVADSGLGLPAEYLGSGWGRAARPATERDEKLLALIQRATIDGSGEIVLTDRIIEDLTGGNTAKMILPPRVEIAVEIHASSTQQLDRGHFTLIVTGTPRPGSSMAGRHAHLLPPDDRDLIAATFTAHEPDTIAAQLSFPPRKRRNENITRTAQLLPHLISLCEHHASDDHLISLRDLAVTAAPDRFSLVRISTGQRVEPRAPHALEASVHTPALARFLSEIATSRCAMYRSFHFGSAAHLPYLPRVRYRERTVLSPARWLLSADDLPGGDASMTAWENGLEAWRERWRVPVHVAVVDHDRRQPMDLSHGLHRLLLRTRLQRAGRLELREAPHADDLAWLGRAHEVLIPLRLTGRTAGPPSAASRHATRPGAVPTVLVAADAGHLPGRAPILYAQLHGHPARWEEILTGHLPVMLDGLGEAAALWWFRRHRVLSRPEADPYLALYLSLPDLLAYGTATEHLTVWAEGLFRARLLAHLSLATYHPQPGRYGHGTALDRAHEVFAADSAAALAQIGLATDSGTHPQAIAAASMVDLATAFATHAAEGLYRLLCELPREHVRLDPALRDQALGLADPTGSFQALAALPGGAEVIAAWKTRATALAAYRQELAGQRDPLTVLRPLLHLHNIRAVGVDPDRERVSNQLARSCALRHTVARTGQ
ncbi:lantibiotic dehydratase [Sphaerisporangium sp. NPDC051017]|uniref:lantibiotic dehydratase n=1 Tax=unclassified Sphaerisporangium TaxID=2630420 RepID=UPI0034070FA4